MKRTTFSPWDVRLILLASARWPCGSDFNYQNADHWYHNLDKLIHYVNQNGSINLMYSTPSIYVEAKHKETLQKNLTWEVRTDDIFPLGDNFHNYWSGYFTSRPALKKQVSISRDCVSTNATVACCL